MRSIARTDVNQAAICARLKSAGASVQILAQVGKGCPDLLVGHRGRNYLLEVKRDAKAKLTVDQEEWHYKWVGQKSIVRTEEEALTAIGVTVLSR